MLAGWRFGAPDAHASNMPNKIRQMSNPVKLWAMAVQAVTILQAVKLNMTQYLTASTSTVSVSSMPTTKSLARVSLTWEDDQGITTQRLEDQLSDIDCGSQPRVLSAFQAGGFSQVEYGSVGYTGFVELL